METETSNYPRWVYGPTHPKGTLLQSEQEFVALEGEWFSHPSLGEQFKVKGAKPQPAPEPEPPAPDMAETADVTEAVKAVRKAKK